MKTFEELENEFGQDLMDEILEAWYKEDNEGIVEYLESISWDCSNTNSILLKIGGNYIILKGINGQKFDETDVELITENYEEAQQVFENIKRKMFDEEC